MTNTAFEEKVLKELKDIKTDVSGLKTDISGLHNKFDRLDDRVDDMESNLTQEIRLQGAYLNQAFDRMNFLQQNKDGYPSHK